MCIKNISGELLRQLFFPFWSWGGYTYKALDCDDLGLLLV